MDLVRGQETLKGLVLVRRSKDPGRRQRGGRRQLSQTVGRQGTMQNQVLGPKPAITQTIGKPPNLLLRQHTTGPTRRPLHPPSTKVPTVCTTATLEPTSPRSRACGAQLPPPQPSTGIWPPPGQVVALATAALVRGTTSRK